MSSKKAREGYLLVDNRNAPIPEAMAVGADLPLWAVNRLFEGATITCNHCGTVVLVNPSRTRPRGYCRKCDAYLCDSCEAERFRSLTCRPFSQVIDEVLTAAEQQAPEANRILLP